MPCCTKRSLHKFPKDKSLNGKRIEFFGNAVKKKNLFICSDHFQPKDFLMQATDVLGRCRRTLKVDAISSQESYRFGYVPL